MKTLALTRNSALRGVSQKEQPRKLSRTGQWMHEHPSYAEGV